MVVQLMESKLSRDLRLALWKLVGAPPREYEFAQVCHCAWGEMAGAHPRASELPRVLHVALVVKAGAPVRESELPCCPLAAEMTKGFELLFVNSPFLVSEKRPKGEYLFSEPQDKSELER